MKPLNYPAKLSGAVKVMSLLVAFSCSLLITPLLYADEVNPGATEAGKSDEQEAFEARNILTYRRLLNSMLSYQQANVDTLMQSMHQFSEKSQTACATDMESLQHDWPGLLEKWAMVHALPVEALKHDNRLLKLESFPLRSGFVGKKTDALLSADTIPDAASLNQQSVVVQGFPALEYLLFSDAVIQYSNACQLLQAILNHTNALLSDVSEALTEQVKQTEQLDFAATLMQLDDLINQLVEGLVDVNKKRFDPALYSDAISSDNGKNTSGETDNDKLKNQSWYISQQSLNYILARIRGTLSYLARTDEMVITASATAEKSHLPESSEPQSDYTVANLLLDIRYRGVSELLTDKVTDIKAVMQQLKATDNTAGENLHVLHQQTTELESFLTTAVFASVSVSRDFNSTDGD